MCEPAAWDKPRCLALLVSFKHSATQAFAVSALAALMTAGWSVWPR